MDFLFRAPCLEVRREHASNGIVSEMETGEMLLEIGWIGKEKMCNEDRLASLNQRIIKVGKDLYLLPITH